MITLLKSVELIVAAGLLSLGGMVYLGFGNAELAYADHLGERRGSRDYSTRVFSRNNGQQFEACFINLRREPFRVDTEWWIEKWDDTRQKWGPIIAKHMKSEIAPPEVEHCITINPDISRLFGRGLYRIYVSVTNPPEWNSQLGRHVRNNLGSDSVEVSFE